MAGGATKPNGANSIEAIPVLADVVVEERAVPTAASIAPLALPASESRPARIERKELDVKVGLGYALNNPSLYLRMLTRLLESNVTQLNIRSPDAEKMK